MLRKQRGLTVIGWLVLLIPLAIVGYGAIRLTPIYLNYMKVVRSMEAVATEFKDDTSFSQNDLKVSLEKRLDIESVDFPKLETFIIRREGESWVIKAIYEEPAPLFGAISLLVMFDKTVTIR